MIAWAVLAVLALSPSRTDAPPREVRVTVVAVLAGPHYSCVPPELRGVAAEVGKSDPSLCGFRFERTVCKSLARGESFTAEVIDGHGVTVTLLKDADAQGRNRLVVKPPSTEEVAYACRCGVYFPILTRHRTPGPLGERLILAVMARPCKKPAD